MTIKKTMQTLLLGGAVAAMIGSFGSAASAQSRPTNRPLEVRQRADDFALLQRQEAKARQSGNYNTAYWTTKRVKLEQYWGGKLGSPTGNSESHESGAIQLDERQKNTDFARMDRQRANDFALLQRQEAKARQSGNYNAAYWASKEKQQQDYWKKNDGREGRYWHNKIGNQ